MANPKYSQFLRNPYTDETIEITASKEDVFLRKRDEQINKWENEQYTREQQQIAQRQTEQLRTAYSYLGTLCYCDLFPISPEIYINENLAKVTRRNRSKPTLADAEKEVGITNIVKVKGLFPGKSKTKLEELRKKAKELNKTQLQEYDQKVKEDEAEYLKQCVEKELYLRKQLDQLSKGSSAEAEMYFSFALDRDNYSVDNINRYSYEHSPIQYIPRTGEIQFSYRIPNDDEILAIAKFKYDEKNNTIEPCMYDSKTAAKWKLRVAESALLRTAALIFLSDKYDIVKMVSITGYLRYYDSAFGNNRTKDVMKFTLTRELFNQISLDSVDPVDLFNRVLDAEIASGLYTKMPYTITPIY